VRQEYLKTLRADSKDSRSRSGSGYDPARVRLATGGTGGSSNLSTRADNKEKEGISPHLLRLE
jgi:hypothetical protein